MILIVLKLDNFKAAYTQDTDDAGCLCGDLEVWGRLYHVSFCTFPILYHQHVLLIEFNNKIK